MHICLIGHLEWVELHMRNIAWPFRVVALLYFVSQSLEHQGAGRPYSSVSGGKKPPGVENHMWNLNTQPRKEHPLKQN